MIARWLPLIPAMLWLAACGGGAPGEIVEDAGSLPMPPRGPVADVEAVDTVVVAGNGRGELVMAWSTGEALGVAAFREPIWQDPPLILGERGALHESTLVLGVLDANRRLLLSQGEEVRSYRPDDTVDWAEQLISDMWFFVPAFGWNEAWAVYQQGRAIPALARYDFEQDEWTFVAELPAPPHTRRNQPALAVAGDGAVVVAYLGGDDGGEGALAVGGRRLQVARFDPQTEQWGEAMRFETGAVQPVLCAEGRVLLWSRLDPDGARLFWSRDLGGGRWSPPESLQVRVGNFASLRCVADDRGRVLAVWLSIDTEGGRTVWAAYFDGVDWSVPESLARADAYDAAVADRIELAGQIDGEAVVIYHRAGENDNQIWSRRFRPGEGWGRPRQVTDCCAPGRVAMDGRGMAAVVWLNRQGVPWWSRLEVVAGEFP